MSDNIFNTKENLIKIIDFIYEIDKIKTIYRQTSIISEDKQENDAEHSWHIAIMAFVLIPFFKNSEGEDNAYFSEININRAVKMLLMHDVIEIYAGDTFCYDTDGMKDKYERETKSAEKIFGMLPPPLNEEFFSLWLEFEEEKTADAIFASIMDKVQPLMLNVRTGGQSWVKHKITKAQVLKRMELPLSKSPLLLREYITELIDTAVLKGYLINK